MEPISTQVVAGWVVLHIVALLAAWCTRLASGSSLEGFTQLGFYAAMACVGVVACFCGQLELGFSVPSGITLVAMVLLAVVDFRPTQEPAGRLHL